EAVRPLGLRAVEQALLRLGATQFQVVQGVLVGFEADHFHDPRAALGLLSGGEPLGLTVLPLGGERDFLQAWEKDGIKVVALFNEDELAPTTVFAVEADYSMSSSSRACEEVKDYVGIASGC